MSNKEYKRQWHLRNKERMNAKSRAYYLAHRTCSDRKPAMSSEELKKRQHEAYIRNRDKVLARETARWHNLTPDERVEHNRKRRERHAKQPGVRNRIERVRDHNLRTGGVLSAGQWQEILSKFNGECIYCGTTQTITIEHLTPVSRGGDNSIANIAPACHSCNSSKRNKTYIEFMLWRAKRKMLHA